MIDLKESNNHGKSLRTCKIVKAISSISRIALVLFSTLGSRGTPQILEMTTRI